MESKNDTLKLPIRPWGENTSRKIVRTAPSNILDRRLEKQQTIELPKSVTAYLDVLGFSNKKEAEDMEMVLLDFAGPLVVVARSCEAVRFNIFSDCAFVSTSIENAAQLLSSIRYAFKQWTADSILVRGGISLGSYKEIHGSLDEIAPKNYVGSYFAGSAVTEAVRLESLGTGALLFASDECAKFYKEQHGEPIFYRPVAKVIGWSDSAHTLYWFVGVSLLRLLKVLSTDDGLRHCAMPHLLSNVNYALEVGDASIRLEVLGILSWPKLNPKAKEATIGLLGIKDQDFKRFQKPINEWLSDDKPIKELIVFANFDSGISGSIEQN